MFSVDDEKIEAVQANETKPMTLIYCGPSLPRGILAQYTTYRSGLPKHLDKHIEKCPAIRRLFISPEKLNSTIIATQTAGTPESVWNKEILDYAQGGAK